jgi:hypothetical protein
MVVTLRLFDDIDRCGGEKRPPLSKKNSTQEFIAMYILI